MTDKKKSSIIDINDLRSLMKIFYKNWYIFILFALSSTIICYFYTHKLQDIYGAKTQILLKSDDTYDYQNQIYSRVGFYQPSQDNDNQMRIITSSDLIRKTLSKLNFEVSYFIVGRLKTTEVYQAMPFDLKVNHISSNLYEQNIKIKILNSSTFQMTFLKDGKEIMKTLPFDKDIIDSEFIIRMNKDPNINDETILSLKEIDYLLKIHSTDNLVNKFKGSLSVESLENTTILELSLEDEIPYRAVTFLDSLSKVYVDYTAESEYTINENTLKNIDKQLKEVTDILTSLEDDLENYKSDKAILDLDKEEGEYFSRLVDFDGQKRNLELYIQSLDALQEYILTLADRVDKKLLPPSFYIEPTDDYMKQALDNIYSMQMERNEKLFGATDKNRNIAEMDQNIELLRKNILTYINNSKAGLKSRISDIQKQIDDYTNIIKGIPNTQRNLLNIQRKVDVNEKMYEFLLEKRSETVISRSGILPQTNIIEVAHSVGIIKPNKRKIYYYFISIGLVLSLVVSFIRTILFSTIEGIEELKRLTQLPVLGEIMYSPEADKTYIIVDKDPKAAITESFRTIRTNLQYMASEANSKVILVTSFNPGEGKTFCSVNLSTIIAKAGKRVLLVELDLHKPKVQKALNMNSDIGISTILIGKTEVADAIMT
ncbi:MAG: hypothetical protein JWQ09_5260, partial [Segetibacter sp.]|nr:hypothetical protein [Segetibacter sp.]